MLSFGLGSQNSKNNQQIQYKFNILEKDVSNTTKSEDLLDFRNSTATGNLAGNFGCHSDV